MKGPVWKKHFATVVILKLMAFFSPKSQGKSCFPLCLLLFFQQGETFSDVAEAAGGQNENNFLPKTLDSKMWTISAGKWWLVFLLTAIWWILVLLFACGKLIATAFLIELMWSWDKLYRSFYCACNVSFSFSSFFCMWICSCKVDTHFLSEAMCCL